VAKIRVLVVDDSAVMRKVISEILAEDPAIEVADTAVDGHIALSKVATLKPDVVTLDVEMPVMNGLEALAEIRKVAPSLPVIMFSTLTERGAAVTVEALTLGASDYCTKPTQQGNATAARESIRSELLPKIKALCSRRPAAAPPPLRPVAPPPVAAARRSTARPVQIVAIGISTGGPSALSRVLPRIPGSLPVPVVIVQHMPAVFTNLLAGRLAVNSEISVSEGKEGTVLHAGEAWIAPGDLHMTVARDGNSCRLRMNTGPKENFCRPSVDVLFRSVADVYGPNALAVVMTGMGADGLLGSKRIREAGGEVIVQDENSSVVWGMPGMVHAAGQADGVYPLDSLAGEITRRVLQSRRHSSPAAPELAVPPPARAH